MTKPYLDTSSRKRTPDWLVTVRVGPNVRTYRFSSEESAAAFVADFEANPPRALLNYHVSGAIERGEGEAIVNQSE